MINVTKTYLPDINRYLETFKEAYDAGWITNNGKLVQRLEQRLKSFLNIDHFLFCANGTVTLQLAMKALAIHGEVLTTPFSYVATTNAILWENCKPVFVDIDPATMCIDTSKIENAITKDTKAIVATHVFGLPCDVQRISEISRKYDLKVIYDAVHAFGAMYNGKSLLDYGDISSCSFHATKIFHSIEGGGLVCSTPALANDLFLMRQFGHLYDDYTSVGINAKNSEAHAAMGLCVLEDFNSIIQSRKEITLRYNDRFLDVDKIKVLSYPNNYEPNYSYYPIIFETESALLSAKENLERNDIFPRRYFFPSLNTLPYIPYQPCPVSEGISRRILCLPLYFDLEDEYIDTIVQIVIKSIT